MRDIDKFFEETPEGRVIMAEIDASIAEGRPCSYMPHMGANWAASHRMQAAYAGAKRSTAARTAFDEYRRYGA